MASQAYIWCPDPAGSYSATVILLVFSTLAVGLRIAARRLKEANLGADDYTIAVALVFVWAIGIFNIVGTARGALAGHSPINPKTGQTVSTPEVQARINGAALYGNIAQIIDVLADGAIKCSLLLMYRRIFIGKLFNMVSIGLLALIAAWTVAFFFATLFQCKGWPGASWYGRAADKEYCEAIAPIWLGHAISDIITDLMVIIVPLPIIAKLNMSWAQKSALLAIFTLGLFSTGAGIARLVYVAQDQYETTQGARDVIAVKTNILLWGFIEAAVGVITACLVTFRPLFKGRTAESIVHSLRSVLSVGSLSCHGDQTDIAHENFPTRIPSDTTTKSALQTAASDDIESSRASEQRDFELTNPRHAGENA